MLMGDWAGTVDPGAIDMQTVLVSRMTCTDYNIGVEKSTAVLAVM
jgi:hypothetical protein